MSMEKRALLAAVLSMLVILAYPYILGKFFPQSKKLPTLPSEIQRMPSAQLPQKVQEVKNLTAVAIPSDEKKINFETEDYKFVFTNLGGGVKGITLKKHLDSQGKPIQLAAVVNPKDSIFSVEGLDPDLDTGAFYSFESKPDRVMFRATAKSGLEVEKEIVFQPGKYTLELRQTITNHSNEPRTFKYKIVGGSGITDLSPEDEMYVEVLRSISGKVYNVNKKSIKGAVSWGNGQIDWASLKNRYFSLILKPLTPCSAIYSNKLPQNELQTKIESQDFAISPNSSVTHSFVLYAGPNDYDKMSELKLGLEDSLHLGFTGGIGKILFVILKFFKGMVKNWGAAIILLTIFINILLFPLTFKSLKSMKQMQALQPKIGELRGTYKDNPQKLNREIMELYKKYKVNPMGGCLPIFLQMPIFFALYQVLMRSSDLRGAKFLWVKDLSQPDRFVVLNFQIPWVGNELNILPLLMAIAMFFQQKMSTPQKTSSSDQLAQQQKMMAVMMPVLFGVMFYRLPSGLVLYWFTNTLLTMVEQEMFLKKPMFHVEHSES